MTRHNADESDGAKPAAKRFLVYAFEGESKAFAAWLGEACDGCGMPAALHGAECDEVD
jgi:hypothetical protein